MKMIQTLNNQKVFNHNRNYRNVSEEIQSKYWASLAQLIARQVRRSRFEIWLTNWSLASIVILPVTSLQHFISDCKKCSDYDE